MNNPEDRYVNLETKILANGKVVYKSARPIPITTTTDDITFVTNEQDRLDIIANNVYSTPLGWWKIAAANGLANGSLHIAPGTTIVIPT